MEKNTIRLPNHSITEYPPAREGREEILGERYFRSEIRHIVYISSSVYSMQGSGEYLRTGLDLSIYTDENKSLSGQPVLTNGKRTKLNAPVMDKLTSAVKRNARYSISSTILPAHQKT